MLYKKYLLISGQENPRIETKIISLNEDNMNYRDDGSLSNQDEKVKIWEMTVTIKKMFNQSDVVIDEEQIEKEMMSKELINRTIYSDFLPENDYKKKKNNNQLNLYLIQDYWE
jgi:hypothetical protein